MRAQIPVSLLLGLAGCDAGSFTLTEGLTDPNAEPAPEAPAPPSAPPTATTDTAPEVDTALPVLEAPTPCGPDAAPGAEDLTGERLLVRTGNALVRQSPPVVGPFRWDGCEVERRYDAAGALRCERVYAVTGNQNTDASSGQTFIYQIERELDIDATTCPDAGEDERRRYRLQITSTTSGSFTLEQAPPRQGRFADFGEGTSQIGWDGFTLNYRTPLEAW